METSSKNTTYPESPNDMNTQTKTPISGPAAAAAPSPKKKGWIGIAVLVAVLALAGAAYLGTRMLARAETANRSVGGGPLIPMKGGANSAAVGTSLNIQNAPEIPQRAPDMNGAVTEVKDNSLMVSAVESMVVRLDENGESDFDIEYQGAATEVVLTSETQIYFDTTFQNTNIQKEMPKEGETIQQTIEPADLSEIGPHTMVSVWGYKRGDRLIAEVILAN